VEQRRLQLMLTQGVSKGAVVARILTECMAGGSAPDFVLCVGDDRSDEDMFQQLDVVRLDPQYVYACTVGQKPSKARFYVNEPTDVLSALEKLSRL
jgi:trehalose 6-phosphate synthase/phosphatase